MAKNGHPTVGMVEMPAELQGLYDLRNKAEKTLHQARQRRDTMNSNLQLLQEQTRKMLGLADETLAARIILTRSLRASLEGRRGDVYLPPNPSLEQIEAFCANLP
jgi:hypothetical protein